MTTMLVYYSHFDTGYYANVSWDFAIFSPLSELASGAHFPNLQDELNCLRAEAFGIQKR